jgi:hypothetical protein
MGKRGDLGWVNRLDTRIAGKVGCVEGEDRLDAMHPHGCYQPGVVRRFTRNPVLDRMFTLTF